MVGIIMMRASFPTPRALRVSPLSRGRGEAGFARWYPPAGVPEASTRFVNAVREFRKLADALARAWQIAEGLQPTSPHAYFTFVDVVPEQTDQVLRRQAARSIGGWKSI